MSRIDDLIAELAPGGVEHRVLGQVAGYSTTRISSAELDTTTFVGVDNLLPNQQGKVDSSHVPDMGNCTEYLPGEILLGNIRPYLKKVWRATNRGGCNGDVLAVRITEKNRLSPEFLYYLLSADSFFAYEMQHAKGAKMPRGDKKSVLNYRIPIPPLDVQREIVKVLDLFSELETELEAKLEAELDARHRQYDHYRDSLLALPEAEVPTVPLSELCDISRGRVISRDYLRDRAGPFAVYSSQTQNNGIFGYIDSYAYDFESITWTTDGANAGSVFYHVDEKFSITNVCGLLRVKDLTRCSTKFLFYQLAKHAKKYVSEGMGNPKLMANAMAAVSLPIPPLEVQDLIVAILDKFDVLVNDLSIGLPAELAARRKQYQYYRDQLLTFEEKVT